MFYYLPHSASDDPSRADSQTSTPLSPSQLAIAAQLALDRKEKCITEPLTLAANRTIWCPWPSFIYRPHHHAVAEATLLGGVGRRLLVRGLRLRLYLAELRLVVGAGALRIRKACAHEEAEVDNRENP